MTGRQITVAELYDDEMSDAYHVGQIDARNRRPRRIDLADTTPRGVAYHHGYDSRRAEPVWCVRHREGWCATKDNHEPVEGVFCVPTRCGYGVTLPGGIDLRQPTCPDCKEAGR